MVIFKDSVRLKVWTPAISYILDCIEDISIRKYPWAPPDFVITSVNDGDHLPNSRHYTNEAIDIRSKNFRSIDDKDYFRHFLSHKLGPKFTVLFEYIGTDKEHFHVQVKKGEIFP